METPEFEMEVMREIHANVDGYSFEVGPDRDGLRCVEVRYKDEKGKICDRMSMAPECADLIAKAMMSCAAEIRLATI